MTHQGPESEVVKALTSQVGIDFDVHFTRDNPHLGEYFGQYKNMMLNWNKMQKLSQYYDKVWLVESDTIPPNDALAKLLNSGAPVVSGLYASRHSPYDSNVGLEWGDIKSLAGQTINVKRMGTGCLLIDRTILDKYEIDLSGYENPKGVPYRKTQIDSLFSDWCIKNGIEQKVRLDVLCGHKKANGEILWPQDFLN